MRKPIATIEWMIAENDADWERLYIPSTPEQTPAANPPGRLKHYFAVVATLLVALIGAGGWGWRTERVALPQLIAEVTATAQPALGAVVHSSNQWEMEWWRQFGQEYRRLRAAIQTNEINLAAVDFEGDQAVVSVVTTAKHGHPAYRQARFYRRITTGWQQTAPDAALWGPEHSLETPSFIFHFRQNDAAAVIAVAPQVETLYATMRRDFSLPTIPTPEKLVIEVSVTHSPVYPLFQHRNPERFVMDDRLVVASPALYLASVELTDADLLAQSIALPMLKIVSKEASKQYRIGASWQPVLEGLRLWQVWEMDLPLTSGRAGIIQWIYRDLPTAASEQQFVMPEQYEELCASHTLWMEAPVMMGIPLLCNGLDWEEWYVVTGGPRHPPAHLDQLAVPVSAGYTYEGTPVWGQTVALATLIEYAVATYGRERLPALVAGLGQYDSWETLVPAVFGVSVAQFEYGWQAYLSAHYGVSLGIPAQ